ncbi:tripartite tricarboxylate transporter substrate-binding protein [Litorivicinus sp.]|jgi:tripartite-type tricarboxylate transporter receptor subunit TctC|nr:tripartite tricarboxylate transporter substrate-binding protein [Litorivicinus sp.]
MIKNILAVSALTLSITTVGFAHADAVADFYKGKTVSVVSPSGVGGSIYKYALLVSNHIGRHIPGNPDVVVEDRGGGGGKKAANYVQNAAPKSGVVIAELHPSSLVVPLISDKVTFSFDTVNWLGSIAVRPYVGVVWNTVKADTLDKMKNAEVTFGASGVGGSSYQYPFFLSKVTGAKLKVIPGYKSGGKMNIAMESGEIDGRGNYYEGFLSTNPDWVRDGKIKYVFRMGEAHPDLVNVPEAASYMKTEAEKQMLNFLEGPLKIGQAFYVHGDVPADRLKAVKKAFVDMIADPIFQADAKKMKLVIRTRTPEQVAAVVKTVYSTPKNVVAELNAMFKKKK